MSQDRFSSVSSHSAFGGGKNGEGWTLRMDQWKVSFRFLPQLNATGMSMDPETVVIRGAMPLSPPTPHLLAVNSVVVDLRNGSVE